MYTKKLNIRNSTAIIREVKQMIESGFPKKETYTVVGAKYNISAKSVQNIMKMEASNMKMEASNMKMEASNMKMEASNMKMEASLNTSRKHYTSADIVDNICKLGKTDDYCKAFEKVKAKYDNIILSDGTEVLF